jgi:hypothetical protein
MRLAVFRMANDAHQLVWTHHHLILDAWSGNLVFKEVFEAYEASVNKKSLMSSAVRPYRDYIGWLQRQDRALAERFWRGLLKGFNSSTPIPIAARANGNHQRHGTDFRQEQLKISDGLNSKMQALAKEQRLTVNTLLQSAWALLLSQYTGRQDVVFGTVVFGRPSGLTGVESMTGLFINTIPFRAQINSDDTVLPWLQSLQRQMAETQQFDYSSLVDIQQWSEVPRGQALFETTFGLDNVISDSTSPQGFGLEIKDYRLVDWTTFPLSLAVTPGAELSIALKFDCRRFAGVVNPPDP